MTFPQELDNRLTQAANLIRESQSGVVFTGAGLSVPSGIPDFRSASSGLWNRFDPMAVASLSAFHNHPDAFFDWLRPLADKAMHNSPNPAHFAIAHLADAGFMQTLITQNIDGFHQAAGSRNVIEIHGSLRSWRCQECGGTYELRTFQQSWFMENRFPICEQCKTYLKPEIVLYEELLPQEAWEQAELACEKADLILVAGTSLEVMPASGLPFRAASHGARVIVINLTPTRLDNQAMVILPMDVAEGLPELSTRVLG